MIMENKKPSFRISEEQLTQTNLGKLSLPEYFVYKTQTPQQSTRALTLPDVLTLTSRSILTSRGPRTQVKSIANPVGSVSIFKSEKSRNFTPVKNTPKLRTTATSTDIPRMPVLEKKDLREKKIVFWENIATLKASLGKYQGNVEEIPPTSKSDLNKIFRFLKNFEELDHSMNGVMDSIIKALENAISVNSRVIESYFSQELRENNEEINKLYNTYLQRNVPYSTLCSEMSKIIAQKNLEKTSIDEHYRSIIKGLEAKIEAQNKSIDDFQVILSQTVPYKLYEETRLQVEAVKQEYQYMVEQNENLQTKNQELGDEYQYLKQLYEQELKETEVCQAQVKDLQKEKGLVQCEVETRRQSIQMMQNRIKGLKDIMDKVIVRLTLIKQDIIQLREQNQNLEAENSKLHVRAAGGFEALTPRPDYKKLEEEKQLDLTIFDPKGKRQVLATVDIVNELFTKINFLQEKIKEAPPKKRELPGLRLTRKDSTTSENSGGENTPRMNRSMFKRDANNLSTLKLSIFTGANNGTRDSNPGTPRSDSSKRGGSRTSYFKKESFTFSTPDINKKGDDSLLNTSDEGSTATALLNNNKYTKSAFSTQRNVALNKKLRESDFGVGTLKETKGLMNDVVSAKDQLKEIEASLE